MGLNSNNNRHSNNRIKNNSSFLHKVNQILESLLCAEYYKSFLPPIFFFVFASMWEPWILHIEYLIFDKLLNVLFDLIVCIQILGLFAKAVISLKNNSLSSLYIYCFVLYCTGFMIHSWIGAMRGGNYVLS